MSRYVVSVINLVECELGQLSSATARRTEQVKEYIHEEVEQVHEKVHAEVDDIRDKIHAETAQVRESIHAEGRLLRGVVWQFIFTQGALLIALMLSFFGFLLMIWAMYSAIWHRTHNNAIAAVCTGGAALIVAGIFLCVSYKMAD